MDCNAPFCEIFQETVSFNFANDFDARAAISKVLVSLFTYETFCTYRDRDYKVENETFPPR